MRPWARYNKVKSRILHILILLACVPVAAVAQYDASFVNYFNLEPTYNAAAVGKQSKLNITGTYALGLAGFKRNPRTMLLSADMPFRFVGATHGVGAVFMNDQIGLFSHQRLQVAYAYKHALFGGEMSIGVAAGLITEAFDGSKVDLEDSSDPAFSSSDLDGNGIDLGAGLYYTHRQWYAGLSVSHLNAPLIKLGDTNELQIDPTYYFTAGYNIKLRNPFLTIKTSGLLRTDMVAWRGDVTARLCYTHEKRVMYIGAGYSPTNSATLLIGGQVHGISVGYSYEMYTGGISLANGSHELVVGYQMDLNLLKKGKNKHKSVRIL